MRVIVAQPSGFCAGVVRAVEIVERAVRTHGAPIYVLHEIVHNRQVIDGLKKKGVRFVETLTEVPPGAITIFSAHGVAKSVEKQAQDLRLRVLDATCPMVSKVHKQGQRYAASGRTVILIGHKGHPEVVGTMGQIAGPVVVVQNEADVNALDFPMDTPLAYVTQTTLSIDDTQNVITALKSRFQNLVGPDTPDICYATQNRQLAARHLSSHVDMVLVVGSGNSSNANRLREIVSDIGIPSYLIEHGNELKPEWLQGVSTIGITAGASTPESMVRNVIDALRQFGSLELSVMHGPEEKVTFRLPAELP